MGDLHRECRECGMPLSVPTERPCRCDSCCVADRYEKRLEAKDAEIASLRTELAEARSALGTAKHQRDEWMRFCDKAERELAEARESASKYHAELVDSLRVVADERDAARQERDAAIRERDARPAISREDARDFSDDPITNADAEARVTSALRAHASGVDAPPSAPAQDGAERCPEFDCVGGTFIHENGMKGKCSTCNGTGNARR